MSTSICNPTDSQARIADWVELQALVSGTGRFTSSQLLRSMNIIDDPIRDADDEDRADDPEDDDDLAGDRGILNDVNEGLSQRVFDELEFREGALGSCYPFELRAQGLNWVVELRTQHCATRTLGQDFYLSALLIAAFKYDYVTVPSSHSIAKGMPDVMQVMSVVAAAEYMGGEAFWMGWPRPHSIANFTTALQNFMTRAKVGQMLSNNPSYDPNVVKDGSVDLIAWRSFRDSKPGKNVLYGQVASGKNWRMKSLQGTFDPHFSGWFINGPTREKVFAMFIPFVQHEDCKGTKLSPYAKAFMASAEKDERAFGIIFDRLRIAEMACESPDRDWSAATGIDFSRHHANLMAWQESAIDWAKKAANSS